MFAIIAGLDILLYCDLSELHHNKTLDIRKI